MQKPEVPSRHRQKRWKWANWATKLETKTRKYQISQVKRPPSLGPAPQLLTKANKANTLPLPVQPKVKDAKTWGPLPTQAKKVEMGKLGPETRDKTRKYQISQVKRPPSLGPAPQLLTKANKANKENPPPLITTNNTVKQNNWTKGWESMKNGNENGEKLTRSKCNT